MIAVVELSLELESGAGEAPKFVWEVMITVGLSSRVIRQVNGLGILCPQAVVGFLFSPLT